MKKNVLTSLSFVSIILASCGDNSTPETPATSDTVTVTKTDTVTVVKTDTVAVTESIDTAAIAAFYNAQHAKKKGVFKAPATVKGNKKISIDSDPIFASTDVIPVPVVAGNPAPPAAPKVVVIHDKEMYYFIPDEKANFPGGEKAFDEYLSAHLEYPEKALEAGESRIVYPTVFLDEEGKILRVEFPGAPTIYGFQDEARRVLLASPRWNPARFAGKKVKSKFTIPINFKLS